MKPELKEEIIYWRDTAEGMIGFTRVHSEKVFFGKPVSRLLGKGFFGVGTLLVHHAFLGWISSELLANKALTEKDVLSKFDQFLDFISNINETSIKELSGCELECWPETESEKQCFFSGISAARMIIILTLGFCSFESDEDGKNE